MFNSFLSVVRGKVEEVFFCVSVTKLEPHYPSLYGSRLGMSTGEISATLRRWK